MRFYTVKSLFFGGFFQTHSPTAPFFKGAVGECVFKNPLAFLRYATELLTDRPHQIGKLKLPYLMGAPCLWKKIIGFHPIIFSHKHRRDRGV